MSIITINMAKNSIVVSQELRACRGCLKTECLLYNLKGEIAKVFTELIGDPIIPSDVYPKHVCCTCLAFLQKFKRFRHRCHETMICMKRLVKAKCLTLSNVNKLNKALITQPLTQTQTETDMYEPSNDMYLYMTGSQVQVYTAEQEGTFTPVVVLPSPTDLNMTKAQAESIARQRQVITALPAVDTNAPLETVMLKTNQLKDGAHASNSTHDTSDDLRKIRKARNEINDATATDPLESRPNSLTGDISEIKIETNDLPDNEEMISGDIDTNLANLSLLRNALTRDSTKVLRDDEMVFLNAAVRRDRTVDNTIGAITSTVNAEGVKVNRNNYTKVNRNNYTTADKKNLNDETITSNVNIPRSESIVNKIKFENEDIVKEENLIHPVDEDDATEPEIIDKDIILSLPNLTLLQDTVTDEGNLEIPLLDAVEKDKLLNNTNSVETSLVNVIDSVKEGSDNLADKNNQQIRINDVPPDVSTVEIKTEIDDIIKEENLIHPVDDNDDVNSETSNKDIAEAKKVTSDNIVMDLISSSSSDCSDDESTETAFSSDNENCVISDNDDDSSPLPGVCNIAPIEEIMVNEVDLTKHDDDEDTHAKTNGEIYKKVIRRKERNANIKARTIDNKTEEPQPPQIETIIVNEVDLTAFDDDDDEINRNNDQEEKAQSNVDENAEHKTSKENEGVTEARKNGLNTEENSHFVYENAYDTDSDNESGDLPYCLAGLNRNIYQKDSKRNFSEPKPLIKKRKSGDGNTGAAKVRKKDE